MLKFSHFQLQPTTVLLAENLLNLQKFSQTNLKLLTTILNIE